MNELIRDTTLYEDIPMSEGRQEREMKVYMLLKSLGIPFLRMDHEPMATIEACQGVDEILGIHMCKNLFLCNSQKTVFYLLLMPGEKKFKTKELSKRPAFFCTGGVYGGVSLYIAGGSERYGTDE